jgi:hypothetical protein
VAVLWFAAPCSVLEVYGSFRGAYCLYQQDDFSLSVYSSPYDEDCKYLWNVGNSYQTTRSNNPNDSRLHNRRHGNLNVIQFRMVIFPFQYIKTHKGTAFLNCCYKWMWKFVFIRKEHLYFWKKDAEENMWTLRKQLIAEENWIVRSFVICYLHQALLGW